MTKLPKGINEAEFLEVLEKAVSDAIRNFKIGYYETEDLKQEARVFALESLKNYRPEKGTLYTFIRTHIFNRLINLKRNISFRPSAPCHLCGNHDMDTSPSERTGCSAYEDRAECVRWVKWMKTNISKRNLSNPSPDETFITKNEDEDGIVLTDIYKGELKNLINRNIPMSLRADYLKMMDGISLPIKRRTKLLGYLKGLLSQNGQNEQSEYDG